MPRGNGGIIGPVNTSFSGVWSLTEAQLRRSGGTWPSVYQQAINELSTGSDAVIFGSAADPYFEYTTLLLPGNGTNGAQNNTFLDGSTNNFTITRNGNTTQGTFSPFSQTGWGNYFGGSPSVLSGSGQLLGVVSNNFTVEAWVFIPTFSGVNNYVILGTSTTSSSPTGIYFAVKPDGNLAAAETWGTNLYVSTGITATAGTWNHVALCRSGSTVRLFLNGVAASNTGSFSAGYNSTSFVIGRTWTTDAANSTYMIGTISNLRVISGQALYSGNFTPSTSPLTSTTVGSTGAGAATSITGTVTLLTCQDNRFKDNSPSNRTITATGSPTVVAFSPFNPTASWSAATYGGSGYFDGTGDYLSNGSAPVANFGTNDFTFEFWVYFTAMASAPYYQIFSSTASIGGFQVYKNASSNNLVWDINGTSTDLILTGLVSNQWYHIAVARSGTNLRTFANGVLTYTYTNSINFTITGAYIGSYPTGASYFPGYISGLRVVKGTAVYTGNFTPPTAPPTAITNTSLLLNFTNAGIYDATSKNDLETVGNAQISTTQSKWGGSSMYFDGAGDYLNFPSSQLFGLGTGDFTIEFWLYLNTVSGTQNLCDFRNATATEVAITLYMNLASPRLYVNGADRITGGNLITGQWYYIALTRSSTSTKFFVDGTQSGSTYSDSNNYLTPRPLRIGTTNDGTPQFPLNAYIQDFRITKGYARYTSNFTAPTAAFPTL